MLSYRHAFHAGNHADVLKHAVLALVIDYLKQKEKPFWYIDTHAGAGVYALDSSEAKKNAEFKTGIERLLEHRDELPASLQPYIAAIDELRRVIPRGYPGSPMIAEYLLRDDDRLRLFELHPQDVELLKENFEGDRRAHIAQSDGFAGLKALLPPPPRRAVVLIDPPYELKDDYEHVVRALQDALQRFSTGTYIVWYPLLSRAEAQRLPKKLAELKVSSLRVELKVENPQGEFGMFGSGLFIINPPWVLHDQLKVLMPELQTLLGKAGEAEFLLEAKD
ncbi:MAG: 23S rRNA (adenine(2030)-N(6))-methyltransferase RlmJ [Spongiibacteraceae bacterium]